MSIVVHNPLSSNIVRGIAIVTLLIIAVWIAVQIRPHQFQSGNSGWEYIHFVINATLTCRGECDLHAILDDNDTLNHVNQSHVQRIRIDQLGPGNWTLYRTLGGSSNWQVNWNVQVGPRSEVTIRFGCRLAGPLLGCYQSALDLHGPSRNTNGTIIGDPIV